MHGRMKTCHPVLGRTIIAFLSCHDFGVDYAFLWQKMAGQTGLGTTKGFEIKWEMLRDLVRSRKSRKVVSEKEREELCLLVQLFSQLLVTLSPEPLFWGRNAAQKHQHTHLG